MVARRRRESRKIPCNLAMGLKEVVERGLEVGGERVKTEGG